MVKPAALFAAGFFSRSNALPSRGGRGSAVKEKGYAQEGSEDNRFTDRLADGGWARNNSQFANTSNTFIGSGLGLAFETKAGIFNIAFAAGKRNDLPFNLRQSKIHFGYVNFF